MANYFEHPCDLCGQSKAVEVPNARIYTNGQPVHICTNCGFVYVKMRRSAEDIANDWSETIFGSGYTAVIPAVKARLTFVAEFIDVNVGLKNKKICDIGAGEGVFLSMVQERYGGNVFGVEPSAKNCQTLTKLNIEHFQGTVEDYQDSITGREPQMDIVTIMWTLENCQSCRTMLNSAYQLLKPGGHVVVVTGSRLLVPFKKPLHYYLSTNPADTHSFRFSANSLQGLLAVSGFETVHVNRYIDNDILCVIGKKVAPDQEIDWTGDNYLDVYNFFERWHVETQMYYAEC